MRKMTGEMVLAAILTTVALGILIRGLVALIWSAQQQYPAQALGVPNPSLVLFGGARISMWSAVLVATTVLVYAALFAFLRFGRWGMRMRAAGQNPLLAAQRGINLHGIYALAWSLSTLTGALAGILMALDSGVTGGMTVVALKAFPAALVGGLDSLVGALVGSLIVAAAEVLLIYYVDPLLSDVVPFLALIAMLVGAALGPVRHARGARSCLGRCRARAVISAPATGRTWRWCRRAPSASACRIHADPRGISFRRVALCARSRLPGFLASVGALSLMLLTGYAGQISLGHAGLIAAGAFTTGILAREIHAPFWITLPASAVTGIVLGFVFGLPSLRLRGLYLAVSTLALHFVVIYLGGEYETKRGFSTGIIVEPPSLAGFKLSGGRVWYFVLLAAAAASLLICINLCAVAPAAPSAPFMRARRLRKRSASASPATSCSPSSFPRA